jgi:hypothetical protein
MFFGPPEKKTDELQEGARCSVTGVVACDKQITVPGTQHKCAFYWVLTEVWDHGARGRGRKMWIPEKAEQGCAEFWIEDDKGKVLVENKPVETELKGGWSETGLIGKKGKHRYTARLIKPGDTVKVTGVVTPLKRGKAEISFSLAPSEKRALVLKVKKKGKN